MNVLLTGGGGFIGAWIAQALLAAGLTPRIFDRHERRGLLRQVLGEGADSLDWACGDIACAADVATALQGCGGVIHLAGLLTPDCRDNPTLGLQVNLGGTINVFEAARQASLKRVVYASTAGVYGPTAGRAPDPSTLYGVYKLAGEGVARVYNLEHGLHSVGLRPYIVYGPGREVGGSAGPSLACKAAVLGQSYTLPYTGTTGMVHVDDVAAAFVQALSLPAAGAHVFNLQGQTASTEQVIAAIQQQVPGARLSAQGAPLPIAARLPDDDLPLHMPGLPHTPLQQGINRTIEVYRRWLG